MLYSFYQKLFKPISIYPLITFRVLFGMMMLFSALRFMYLGWIDEQLIDATFQFKYYGFHWVEPLSRQWMYALFFLKIIALIGIITGTFHRLSAVYFFLAFTYFELIDKTYYLNHYYFVSLVAFLLIFLPLNKFASGDVWLRKKQVLTKIPAIFLYLVLFQVGIVYFYAGIAKLHPNWWLEAMPLKIWLPAHHHLPLVGALFFKPWLAYVMSWLGLFFDLTIPFWLLSRWWKPAFLAVVAFHITTGFLFQIGMFPIIMIFTVPVFFPEKFHQIIWSRFKSDKLYLSNFKFLNKNLFTVFVIIYVFIQIVFPWRFLLYPGNMFWTEQGYRFGWRVMLMEKSGTATFYVKDGSNGREGQVINSDFLKPHQEKQMAMQPDMILEYAHFLANHYKENGIDSPKVRAEVYVTLNGAKSKLLINPSINLVDLPLNLKNKDWILPFQSENKQRYKN